MITFGVGLVIAFGMGLVITCGFMVWWLLSGPSPRFDLRRQGYAKFHSGDHLLLAAPVGPDQPNP